MTPTIESIEHESALARAEIISVGADIKRRADPSHLIDQAKDSLRRQTEAWPSYVKSNAKPISVFVIGMTLGAVMIGLPRRGAKTAHGFSPGGATFPSSASGGGASARAANRPSFMGQVKAALLSAIAVALGYGAGLFIPNTGVEENLLGGPKDVLRAWLDDFVQQHARGMKLAVADAFGVSSLSAGTLVALALLADAFAKPARQAKSDPQ